MTRKRRTICRKIEFLCFLKDDIEILVHENWYEESIDLIISYSFLQVRNAKCKKLNELNKYLLLLIWAKQERSKSVVDRDKKIDIQFSDSNEILKPEKWKRMSEKNLQAEIICWKNKFFDFITLEKLVL